MLLIAMKRYRVRKSNESSEAGCFSFTVGFNDTNDGTSLAKLGLLH